MAKLGRKCKLTPELQSKICKYIEDGNYAIHACQAVGISTVTFYDWIKRGELDASSNSNTKFSNFFNSTKEAEAKAITANVKNIRTAARAGEWTASAWFLERKYPDLFGKRTVEPVVENKILIQLRESGQEMLAINTSKSTPLITTSVAQIEAESQSEELKGVKKG